MRNYWRPRGRRKAIRKFTLWEGLRVVVLVSILLVGILLLVGRLLVER